MNQKGLWEDSSSPVPVARRANVGEAPLAFRMSPRTFEEFAGQEDLVGPGKALRMAIEADKIPSVLFWGPPGTGKTALSRLIALLTKSAFVELSAVTSGVGDVRDTVEIAKHNLRGGKRTILFLDEIHRFNKTQQDAVLPHVENGTLVLIGATTENPYFAVNGALRSRMRLFRFEHLAPHHIESIVDRAVADERGLAGKAHLQQGVRDHIVRFSKGDARTALNLLEAIYFSCFSGDGKTILTLEKALEVSQSPALLYDRDGDQHYDTISAYIKSMRGGDPDAALYWLARMLEAGEDPRYVGRRLVICASEDVGLADPQALLVAEAAFRASEHLGMPEARIPLAQATIYVALAPKDNTAMVAIDSAIADVREKPPYPVPVHLRGTGYPGAKELGHGEGYVYPHSPGQSYLPPELLGVRYFKPAKPQK